MDDDYYTNILMNDNEYDSQTILEAVKLLYKDQRNQYVRDFMISKMNDDNCKYGEKIASIYCNSDNSKKNLTMDDYDSDDDDDDYYMRILKNSNQYNSEKILEAVKFLYNDRENQNVRDFMVSKIKDDNCKDAGKIALIYYKDTKEEWVKNLMEHQSRQNNPASLGALQFTLVYDTEIEFMFPNFEFPVRFLAKYQNAYRLFEKYLNSDDEYEQYEAIKFLFSISNPYLEIKDVLLGILTNPDHKYQTEIAMICFPLELSILACDKCHSFEMFSSTVLCVFIGIIFLPISIYTTTKNIHTYLQLRSIFFICVQIFNLALIDENFSVAKYLLYVKSIHIFPKTLHMINFESAYEIVKNTYENGNRKEKQEAISCLVESCNKQILPNDDYSDFNTNYLKRIRNLERFNLKEIKLSLSNIETPKIDIETEIEKLHELTRIGVHENISKIEIFNALNGLSDEELIYLKHILCFLNKNNNTFSDFKVFASVLINSETRHKEIGKLMIDAVRHDVPLNLDAKQLIARVVILPFVIKFGDMRESIKYNRNIYGFEDYFNVKDLIKEFGKNYIPVQKIVMWLDDNKLEHVGIYESVISDYGILNILMKMEFLRDNERNNRFLEKLRLKDLDNCSNSGNSLLVV